MIIGQAQVSEKWEQVCGWVEQSGDEKRRKSQRTQHNPSIEQNHSREEETGVQWLN